MSDIMPKVKLYVILCIITLIINVGVLFTGWASSTQTNDLNETGVGFGQTQIDFSENGSVDNPRTWWDVIFWWVTGGFAGNNQGLLSLGTAFFPFISIFPLSTLNIEPNIFTIISIALTILGIIQSLIIVFFGLQLVSNLIYHPDV